MGTSYIPLEWRLFIDNSKSMKYVLLHNGNKLAFIPIGHSIQMKETYENIKAIAFCTCGIAEQSKITR